MKCKIFLLSFLPTILLASLYIWKVQPQPVLAAVPLPISQIQIEKPIDGWTICKDLGVGPVPGVSGNRQRVRLCHPSGWIVNTYCLRPDLPVPPIGNQCRRTGEDTYYCGRNWQPLKEYQIRETPTPPTSVTPTLTATTTQTVTPTMTPLPSSTPIPSHRPSPGGYGFRDLITIFLNKIFFFRLSLNHLAINPTPFQPILPTPTLILVRASPAIQVDQAASRSPSGIQIQSGQPNIHFRIKPDTKLVNSGKPIDISFHPASRCKFGNGKACINAFQDSFGVEITFITVHSGIGGEAELLRNALEGTGFDQAGYPLRQVKKNLQAIIGSPVTITQNDIMEDQLKVVAAVRLPAARVREYINTPITDALAYAAQFDPDLQPFINPISPIIVLETCGWRMPGERTSPNVSDTSASIYLIILRSNTVDD